MIEIEAVIIKRSGLAVHPNCTFDDQVYSRRDGGQIENARRVSLHVIDFAVTIRAGSLKMTAWHASPDIPCIRESTLSHR